MKITSACCPTSCRTVFSLSQDRGLIEDGAFGPQAEEADIIMVAYALEDALSGKNIIKVLSDDIGVLA